MRIVTWNMRRATETSSVWKVLTDLNPDIALLQEVSGIPDTLFNLFDIKLCKAVGKSGNPQIFGTALFVKGKIISELSLTSEFGWVNQELRKFAGNLVSCIAQPAIGPLLNLVSVYSPAWPIDTSQYTDINVETIKLKQNSKLWLTEILWSALKNNDIKNIPWIVGGDFNSSETFDLTFSSGNREILDRMEALGFTECLRKHNGRLIPTFKNLGNGKLLHQIDHLFISGSLSSNLENCTVGDENVIFKKSMSDHLPIIATFNYSHL